MRVAVDAYFDNNLGDDLFLDVLINRYKDIYFDFLINDRSSSKTFVENPRVSFKSRKKVLKNITSYDAYIFIGGSMFQEPQNWKNQWRKFNITVKVFNLFRKSTFVLGCNFGPFVTEEYKSRYLKTFNKLTHMTVRDNFSYELLKDYVKNLSLHPDIVLSRKLNTTNLQSDNLIGISIIDWPKNKKVSEYISFNKTLIAEILEQEGKRIRLFAFQNSNEINDLILINKVLEKLDNEEKDKIEVVVYRDNINEFLNLYNECKYMVTTRFHSLILSLISNQFIFPIIYSEKTINTIKTLNINLNYSSIDNLSNLSLENINEKWLENKRAFSTESIKDLADKAEGHFKVLDTYLKKDERDEVS